MKTSRVDIKKQTALRRYALALLRRRRPVLCELPSILSLTFGVAGAFGAFLGNLLFSRLALEYTDLTMAAFCLGGSGILGALGGLLGRKIIDSCLRPYIPVAAALLHDEASPSDQ